MDETWRNWIMTAFLMTRLSKLMQKHQEKIVRIFASVLAVVLNFEAINMKKLKEKRIEYQSLQKSQKILTCVHVSEEIVVSLLQMLSKPNETLDLMEAKLSFMEAEHTLLSTKSSPTKTNNNESMWQDRVSTATPKVEEKKRQRNRALNNLVVIVLKRTECILQFGPENWTPLNLQTGRATEKNTGIVSDSLEIPGKIKHDPGDCSSSATCDYDELWMSFLQLANLPNAWTEAHSSEESKKYYKLFTKRDMKALSGKLQEYLWLLAFLGDTDIDTATAVNDAVISFQIRVHTVCWAYAMIMSLVKTLNCNEVLLELLTFFSRSLTTQISKKKKLGSKSLMTYKVWFDPYLKEKDTFFKEILIGLIKRLDEP
jgi:hypothetical protein